MQNTWATFEHKTIAENQKVQLRLERTLEELRLQRLKATLPAKMATHFDKIRAA